MTMLKPGVSLLVKSRKSAHRQSMVWGGTTYCSELLLRLMHQTYLTQRSPEPLTVKAKSVYFKSFFKKYSVTFNNMFSNTNITINLNIYHFQVNTVVFIMSCIHFNLDFPKAFFINMYLVLCQWTRRLLPA